MKGIGTLVVGVLLSATVSQAQTTFKSISVGGGAGSNSSFSTSALSSSTLSSSPMKAEAANSGTAEVVVPVAPSMLVRPVETPRAADKKFWIINAFDAVWTVADVETTVANLNSNPYCREMNPLVGTRPSRTTLYLSNIPVMVGAGYLSYRSHKRQGKRWYLLPSIAGGAHAAGALWNVAGSNCR